MASLSFFAAIVSTSESGIAVLSGCAEPSGCEASRTDFESRNADKSSSRRKGKGCWLQEMPKSQKLIKIAESQIKSPSLLSHLKETTLMVKYVHFMQAKAQTQMDSLKDAFPKAKVKSEFEVQKQIKLLLSRQDKLEANQSRLEATQAKMSGQLDEGEIISKSKCKKLKQSNTDDRDDAPDGGSKGGNTSRSACGNLTGSSGVSKTTSQYRKGGGRQRPTKGIVIKEVSQIADAERPVLRSQVILNADRRYKSKEKVGETSKPALKNPNFDSDVSTPDQAHVADIPVKADKSDHTIPEGDSNSDTEGSKADNTELTFEEKKKLLWESKIPAPKRDSSETIKKIYNGNSQSRMAGRRGGLGLPNDDN
ncbi:hypothetical protein AgCh_016993 [Apium graveolens]